jgi:hypothetical protein
MKTQTIARKQPNGAIVWLSDGGRYLVQTDHHAAAAALEIGQTVEVRSIDYPPNGFELHSLPATSGPIIVVWVSS